MKTVELQTKCGKIQGIDGENCFEFRGIKYAETYLVERGISQSFKSLRDKVIALQIPYITGRADRIIRCSVGIPEMIFVMYLYAAVIIFRRRRDRKSSFVFPVRKISADRKMVFFLKRWHESYFVYSVPIVKTIDGFALGIAFK